MSRVFCWERSVGMKWSPVIYERRPDKSIEHRPERSEFYEIGPDIDLDGCIKRFPAPAMDATK